MTKKRIDLWKEAKYLMTMLSGVSEENDALVKQITHVQKQTGKAESNFSFTELVMACREIIYDEEEGVPVFRGILHSFDVEKGKIKLEHAIDILVTADEENNDTEDQIINTLATAVAFNIPVYPNTKELAPILARLHRKLLIDGFTAPGEGGERVRLKLTKSPGEAIDSPSYLHELDLTETYSPADLKLFQEAVSKELERLENANSVLASLAYSSSELERLLLSSTRNENNLQRFLTENPILFGTEYKRVISKHKLGAEFEMDYALERHSGLVDIVEIESSNLKLFTKSGNPSQYLVHAEQQVLDWLDWIETHSIYARKNLPGAFSPAGYIIIGRRETLSESDKNRLRRRNLLFRGQLEILTYEDLLDRAKNLSKHLELLGNKKQGL